MTHRRSFRPEFINPTTSEELRAWFHWTVGHHHLFLYWLLIAESCREVTRGVTAQKSSVAALWLRRANTLMLGSIGAMMNSGDFRPEMYQDFLRPSMVRVREDFSAASSVEYYHLKLALEGVEEALAQAYGSGPMPADITDAQRAFNEAKRMWFKYHFQAARQLQPGDALLDIALKRMEQEGHKVSRGEYMEKVIRSPQAQADYDYYFGVERMRGMYAEDFRAYVFYTIGSVRRHLTEGSMDADMLRMIYEGDELMKTIVEEVLDPRLMNRVA
ncbi:MAG: hypothetical protein WCD76_02270 [Pyrinomonadaceae bacterium]